MPLRESLFQDQVIDLAHAYHWRVAHFRPAKTEKGWRTPVQADGEGFPDLVMVRGHRVIYAELKAEKGRVAAAQQAWLDALRGAHDEVYLWRPSMFEEIHELLKLER